MRVTYRPIGSDWQGERSGGVQGSRFKRAGRAKEGGGWEYGSPVPWPDTLALLDRELSMLGVDEFVLQLDMAERDIRLDGLPRSDARPSSTAVIISFEASVGALRYQCDTFDTWQANVRAIALGLEALRKIDRYGISGRGQQYTGWLALPAQSQSHTEALAFLGSVTGHSTKPDDSPENLHAMYREAVKVLHPDMGGKREMWEQLQRAKAVLGL